MKMKEKRKFRTVVGVIVTDIDGKVQKFSSIAQAAKALDVTVAYVYLSIKKGTKIRGCKVEATYKSAGDKQ